MFIQFESRRNIKLLFLFFSLLISGIAQKCDTSQYQPLVQEYEIIYKFSIQTIAFDLNVLLTADSLLITLRDFQNWALYIRQYTSQDIGRQIDKKFGLDDIAQKLRCNRVSSNEGHFPRQKYSYGQTVDDNGKPCFKVQKSGLIIIYFVKELKANVRIEQTVSQVQLQLLRVRSMTRREIQNVKNELVSEQKQNLQDPNFSQRDQSIKDDENIDQEKNGKETVFNKVTDKRQPVDVIYPFPYSTIGIIEVRRLGLKNQGTGFLIAPNLVMTAAHNLYDKKIKEQIISVIFLLNAFGLEGRKFQVSRYYFPEKLKYATKQDSGLDYCILVLEEKVQRMYGFLPVDWSGNNIGEVQIAGYPAYVYKGGVTFKAPNRIVKDKGICENDKDSKGMVRYQVQTSSGQSGSPILREQNGEFKVIGIHTIGYRSFNQGLLLTNEIKLDLIQWLRKEKIQTIFNDAELENTAQKPLVDPSTKIDPKVSGKSSNDPKPNIAVQDGVKYDGNRLNGLKEGKGTERYPNGDYYEGQFKQNSRNGKGSFFSEGTKFEGVWQNGARLKGTYTEKDGSSWQLEYILKENGAVIQIWKNNGVEMGRYQGFMKYDKKQGRGTYFWFNGNRYDGDWKNGKAEGQGTFYWTNGRRWVGEFKNDRRHGKGIEYLANGDKYEEQWQNGARISRNKI